MHKAIAVVALMMLATPARANPFDGNALDARIAQAMQDTGAKGLAVAVIEDGKVAYVQAYGERNAKGEPLGPDTVMYGASLTKSVFAYTVLQLVDEGVIELDASISKYLARPLPDYTGFGDAYAPYETLTDGRLRRITPRMLLTHSAGFSNFYWDNPGEKLVIHFDPGRRYAYRR